MLRRRRGGKAFRRGREAIRQTAEIVLIILFLGLGFARLALVAIGRLLLSLLSRCDQPEIMLGMLEVAFGHHGIAGRLGIAGELEIFFANVMGCATDFDVWTV